MKIMNAAEEKRLRQQKRETAKRRAAIKKAVGKDRRTDDKPYKIPSHL
jgi:hypothetical protein